MVRLDVVALLTAVGGIVTAVLNYLHGRDDQSQNIILKNAVEEQARHTLEITNKLDEAFKDTRTQLWKLISELRKR